MIIVKIYYHGNQTPPLVKPSGMAWHNRLTVTRSEGVLDFVITRHSYIDPSSIGQLEGFTHQASLIILDEHADCMQLKNLAFDYLSQQDAISFGVSVAPVNGIITRMHGNKAEQLFKLIKSLSQVLMASSGYIKRAVPIVL